MNTILLSTDLMLTSQVSQAARQMGASIQVVSNVQRLIEGLQADENRQVILDLNSATGDPGELVTKIRQSGTSARIIAIAPHVHTAKIEAARESGCDQVLTKGQFHSTMQDWFRSDG